jgi:hypothetical protein
MRLPAGSGILVELVLAEYSSRPGEAVRAGQILNLSKLKI